jgi:hypothetical protein
VSAARGLIRPAALITRCHGMARPPTRAPWGKAFIAQPTVRAAPGRPAMRAICP